MSPTEAYSLILSIAVASVALLLWAWQRFERNRRVPVGSPEDNRHFRRQDVRRTIVAAVMGILAIGIYVGSRMETRVAGRPNLQFVETWIGIFLLILALLVLAMIDWFATRGYAFRHRSAILQEGIEILKDELRAKAAQDILARDLESRNGHSSMPAP